MITLRLILEDQMADWLKSHSKSLGKSPEELIQDLLVRRQKLTSFQSVADKLYERSVRSGIKSEEDVIQASLRPKHTD